MPLAPRRGKEYDVQSMSRPHLTVLHSPPPPPTRLGAIPGHPESSQHLGLCPAVEGHRQPAGTVPPLPGAGTLRRELGLEQAVSARKTRAEPRGRRLATAGQGSPQNGLEALERVK